MLPAPPAELAGRFETRLSLLPIFTARKSGPSVREPTLPNGNPADETEEYAVWETARLKAADAAAIAWTELATIRPTTGAGAIALINCYLEIWSEQPSKVDYREVSGALKTLRAFLRSIAE